MLKDYSGRDYQECFAQELFEQQAELRPNSVAIAFRDQRLTYRELNFYANQLANRLYRVGLRPDALVGVFFRSCPESIAAVLAVLKSGGAFVPLDPTLPGARLETIIRNSCLRMILTSADLEPALPQGLTDILCVESPGLTADGDGSSAHLDQESTSESAACVIYTSGSTGLPKGVVRTHRGIVSRLAWTQTQSDDVFCHNMSLTTGFSQERIFVPLMCGLPLVVISEEDYKDADRFAGAVEDYGITQITTVPGFLRQILDLGSLRLSSQFRCVRSVAVGGAELSADLVARFQSVLPQTTLINAYGSSETGSVIRGAMSQIHVSEGVTIGRPVANAEVHILGDDMSPLVPGAPGELYIGGPSLAREYLNQPELTAERFLVNPCWRGHRLYRSGDRGRYLPNGEIELLGRVDRQVKVRGFRVELEEVENQLQQHESVQEAFVKAMQTSDRDNKLVAYLQSRPGVRPSITTLRRHLRQFLPEYMTPSTCVWLEQLPRTLNGKIDSNALPLPSPARPALDSPYEPPRNSQEAAIVALWESVLEVKGLGIHDDFLELGGDSLSATQVMAPMAALGIQVTLQILLERGTIASLVSRDSADLRSAGSFK
jgi:amino acid adenylation domain-containing protein